MKKKIERANTSNFKHPKRQMRNERVKGSIRLLSGIEHTRNGVSTWKRLLFKWGREFWNFEGKLPKNYKFISKLRQKITTLICNFFPTKILTTGVEKITKNYKKSFVIFFSKFCLQTVRKYYKKWQFVRINYNLDTLLLFSSELSWEVQTSNFFCRNLVDVEIFSFSYRITNWPGAICIHFTSSHSNNKWIS